MNKFIRTFLVWGLGLPVTAVCFLSMIPAYLIDRSGNAAHSIATFWAKAVMRLAGITVSVRGIENIPRGVPLIILACHRGAFDIPALQSVLPVQFRWVAKKSLFKLPLVGWSMTLAGYISIDREKGASAYKSIDAAAEKIRAGTSVLIFPEGTRNTGGELLLFKKGGFTLAEKSGAAIVPVAIAGTERILKKGGFFVFPSPVSVSIGRPISPAGHKEKELREITREAIEGLRRGR
ncbi:MAG: 1-acyl-sn-glycerol-3-phosphate acyltransferase [Deltaproteobacteria bacterium]|nr:1-acyl-sn-glycerol-3-phosphate acyltransferase [Deltaproteobacteria bacterium]